MLFLYLFFSDAFNNKFSLFNAKISSFFIASSCNRRSISDFVEVVVIDGDSSAAGVAVVIIGDFRIRLFVFGVAFLC